MKTIKENIQSNIQFYGGKRAYMGWLLWLSLQRCLNGLDAAQRYIQRVQRRTEEKYGFPMY